MYCNRYYGCVSGLDPDSIEISSPHNFYEAPGKNIYFVPAPTTSPLFFTYKSHQKSCYRYCFLHAFLVLDIFVSSVAELHHIDAAPYASPRRQNVMARLNFFGLYCAKINILKTFVPVTVPLGRANVSKN
jgi:hypothetical protein